MGRSTPALEASDPEQALLQDKQSLPPSRTRLARFQAVLEEGHAAAGTTILISVVMGLVLGFAVPTDKNLPGMGHLFMYGCAGVLKKGNGLAMPP